VRPATFEFRHSLDATVFSACRGHHAAIDHVARQLRRRLLDAVRRARRPYTQDAEDVVQDLFVAMLERRIDLGPDVAGSVDRLMAHAAQQARR
jgi:DNA-directed RNA polymerase specialized sigma24 family protein